MEEGPGIDVGPVRCNARDTSFPLNLRAMTWYGIQDVDRSQTPLAHTTKRGGTHRTKSSHSMDPPCEMLGERGPTISHIRRLCRQTARRCTAETWARHSRRSAPLSLQCAAVPTLCVKAPNKITRGAPYFVYGVSRRRHPPPSTARNLPVALRSVQLERRPTLSILADLDGNPTPLCFLRELQSCSTSHAGGCPADLKRHHLLPWTAIVDGTTRLCGGFFGDIPPATRHPL